MGTYPNSRDTKCLSRTFLRSPTWAHPSSLNMTSGFTWLMTNQHPRNSLEVVSSFNPFKHVLVNMAVLPKLGWTCRIKVLGESHVDFSNPTKQNKRMSWPLLHLPSYWRSVLSPVLLGNPLLVAVYMKVASGVVTEEEVVVFSLQWTMGCLTAYSLWSWSLGRLQHFASQLSKWLPKKNVLKPTH